MKIKKANIEKEPSAGTTVTPAGFGFVKIMHTQGVKQSLSFQTADCGYSVELYVHDNPKAISAGIKRAEDIVENALGEKLPDVCMLLESLAKKNGRS